MENVGSSAFSAGQGVSWSVLEEGSKALAVDFRMGLKCWCSRDRESTDGEGKVCLIARAAEIPEQELRHHGILREAE